ncbi:helix-turn-helix transcriptional regulator [Neisseriaceae bacterium ESL0693]|nr:helix-turn-helix transcriptional regulator [Neisseriaceae bacterium ESL0693]
MKTLSHPKTRLSAPFTDSLPYQCWFRVSSIPAYSTYSEHSHPWGEFIYAFEGMMEVETKQQHLIAPHHYAIWIPPSQKHECLSHYATRSCSFYLMPACCEGLPANACTLATSELSRAVLHYLHNNLPTIPITTESKHLFSVLIDQIKHMPIHNNFLPATNDILLLNLMQYIAQHPEDQRPISQLAQEIGLTERTLNRHSHQQLGMPFAQWRRRYKIVHAIKLLDQGEKVESVAYSLGYSSASALIRMFQSVTGKTPRQNQHN